MRRVSSFKYTAIHTATGTATTIKMRNTKRDMLTQKMLGTQTYEDVGAYGNTWKYAVPIPHNPKVAGPNPAPATKGSFQISQHKAKT